MAAACAASGPVGRLAWGAEAGNGAGCEQVIHKGNCHVVYEGLERLFSKDIVEIHEPSASLTISGIKDSAVFDHMDKSSKDRDRNYWSFCEGWGQVVNRCLIKRARNLERIYTVPTGKGEGLSFRWDRKAKTITVATQAKDQKLILKLSQQQLITDIFEMCGTLRALREPKLDLAENQLLVFRDRPADPKENFVDKMAFEIQETKGKIIWLLIEPLSSSNMRAIAGKNVAFRTVENCVMLKSTRGVRLSLVSNDVAMKALGPNPVIVSDERKAS